MKAIVASFILAASSVLFFSSCSEISNALSSGVNFTEAEAVKSMEAMILEHIKPEMEIINIDFKKATTDGATFSNNKGIATIVYVNPENPKKRIDLEVDLKTGEASINEFWKDKENFRPYKGMKNVTKLGSEKIADNINAASQLMAEKGTDGFSGIGSYSIEFDSKKETFKHRFTLEKKTSTSGRMVYYDEYKFEADAEGNVKPRK